VSDVMFVRDLVNRGVMNSHGEKLGRIARIAVNMETGRIEYAVLNFGGFPKLSKLFAVPWELLTYSRHDRRFLLEVPRTVLASGLAFDTLEQIHEGASFAWLGQVYEYYSDKPDWEHRRQQQIEQDAEAAKTRRASIVGPDQPSVKD
jgi:sporulation protein YlmC with PRC-barrel domain